MYIKVIFILIKSKVAFYISLNYLSIISEIKDIYLWFKVHRIYVHDFPQ